MKNMPANNMQYVKAQPVVTLHEGEELRVRVYPWYSSSATGKTICLSDLTIHGMATDATTSSIQSVKSKSQQTEQAYDLQGRRQSFFRSGLTIVRQADGSVRKVVF